jgi:hypothetical protein
LIPFMAIVRAELIHKVFALTGRQELLRYDDDVA